MNSVWFGDPRIASLAFPKSYGLFATAYETDGLRVSTSFCSEAVVLSQEKETKGQLLNVPTFLRCWRSRLGRRNLAYLVYPPNIASRTQINSRKWIDGLLFITFACLFLFMAPKFP